MNALFVYGTLMSGQSRADMLGDAIRKPATTNGQLWRLPAGYPALVPGGSALVHGELVLGVSDRLLGLIDTYEGVAEGLYRRVEIDVTSALRRHRCLTYVMDNPADRGGRLIRSGRFRAVRRDG